MRTRALRAVGVGAAALLGVCSTALSALAGGAVEDSSPAPSALASADVPAAWLGLTEAAAATCPGLSWSVLAAIARVESDFGADDATSSAGAEGPMQFLRATFAAYDHPIPADPIPNPPAGAAPASIDDPTDAVFAAARMLCADGAADPTQLAGAVWDYNHSGAYVAEVVALARGYAAGGGSAGAAVAAYARSQIGVAYRYGAESAGVGFDCSGLAAWAWAQAGVALPRSAQEQFDAGPPIESDQVGPGDLVFFGSSADAVTHVGIAIGDGLMVDAPHAGAAVRVDEIAGFSPPFVRASDPGDGP